MLCWQRWAVFVLGLGFCMHAGAAWITPECALLWLSSFQQQVLQVQLLHVKWTTKACCRLCLAPAGCIGSLANVMQALIIHP